MVIGLFNWIYLYKPDMRINYLRFGCALCDSNLHPPITFLFCGFIICKTLPPDIERSMPTANVKQIWEIELV